LLDKAIGETDAKKRQPMLDELVKMMVDDVMFIPFMSWDRINAGKPQAHDVDKFKWHAARWNPSTAWLSQ